MRTVLVFSAVALSLGAIATAVALPGSAAARSRPTAHAAIVGGSAAPSGTWPWLAYIDDNDGPGADYNCTGTVVAPKLVLTAAHCAEDVPSGTIDNVANFTVVTGSLDKTNTSLAQVSGVSAIIPHATTVESSPAGVTIIGDAALLVLAKPTTATAIPLADSTDLALLAPGTPAFFAGWGLQSGTNDSSHPNTLQYAPTVMQNPNTCTIYKSTFDSQAQLCARDSPWTSTCGGDSGGPLVAETTASQWIEIGVTSTVGPDCDPTYPQYFTRVDYISGWVEACIADIAACDPALAPAVTTAAPTPIPTPASTPASNAAPPPAVIAAPSPPAAPFAGNYAGRSSQHRGRVGLTVTAGAIIDLRLKFNLACDHRERGPLDQTYARRVPVTLTKGVWGFSADYRNAAGWYFSVSGDFSPTGTATGRLAIRTENAACRSGAVDWSATIG